MTLMLGLPLDLQVCYVVKLLISVVSSNYLLSFTQSCVPYISCAGGVLKYVCPFVGCVCIYSFVQHFFTQYGADIPHFKQVVVMATACEYCGHKSNEVKSGSGVSEFGTRIKLKLTRVSDLSRDLIQVR